MDMDGEPEHPSWRYVFERCLQDNSGLHDHPLDALGQAWLPESEPDSDFDVLEADDSDNEGSDKDDEDIQAAVAGRRGNMEVAEEVEALGIAMIDLASG